MSHGLFCSSLAWRPGSSRTFLGFLSVVHVEDKLMSWGHSAQMLLYVFHKKPAKAVESNSSQVQKFWESWSKIFTVAFYCMLHQKNALIKKSFKCLFLNKSIFKSRKMFIYSSKIYKHHHAAMLPIYCIMMLFIPFKNNVETCKIRLCFDLN